MSEAMRAVRAVRTARVLRTVRAVRAAWMALWLALSVTLLPGPAAAAGRAAEPVRIQTFTFDSLATRRAEFEFPPAGPWRRVLMHYTLKCDAATPGDPYPCGEWDTNTYTRVWRHTGVLDSTLFRQPRFRVAGESPERLLYSRQPRWQIVVHRDRPAPVTVTEGHYLDFDGHDHLELPAGAFAGVDSALTIAFWCRGAPQQPRADQVLEAGQAGGRVVNIHLPWSTGVIYWDAGGRLGGNNNRIEKVASPADYKGVWHHYAFVKDARSGRMEIYLDGALWHAAGNMRKGMAGIDRVVIGAGLGGGGGYRGSLDAVRIYEAALSAAEIARLAGQTGTAGRPGAAEAAELPRWDALIAAYDFEDDPAGRIRDSGPRGNDARAFGLPQVRPFGLFGAGDLLAAGPARRDSIPAAQLSVVLYEDPADPRAASDTLTLWPAYDELFDADGRLLEQLPIAAPDTLQQSWREWYGAPFEVVEPIEIARFITPYGKRLDLGDEGFTWTVDVTDYAPLLRGRVDLEAHNGYELLDLSFDFIPGPPARPVLAIANLWPGGGYSYRELADNQKLTPRRLTLAADATGFAVRSRISGHGHAGPHNCCEWAAKEHSLLLGGLPRFTWTVWRDCGFNPLYPQGGTWQFDRAGWCPGSFVRTHLAELTPWVEPGREITLDYQVEPYDPAIEEASGSFFVEHQLFSYGPIRARNDVAVERILAPSGDAELRRLNPPSIHPLLVIRNLGSDTLRSVRVRYGLEGAGQSEYPWRGALPFGAADTLILPKPDWHGLAAGARFRVELDSPNGRRDEYAPDNRATSLSPAPLLLPARFTIRAELPDFDRWRDNSWRITDAAGEVVAERRQYTAPGVTDDPVELPPGSYTFLFSDREEDGLIRHWWLRGSDPESIGEDGRLRLIDAGGAEILDLGYDFAEKRVVRFFVGEPR